MACEGDEGRVSGDEHGRQGAHTLLRAGGGWVVTLGRQSRDDAAQGRGPAEGAKRGWERELAQVERFRGGVRVTVRVPHDTRAAGGGVRVDTRGGEARRERRVQLRRSR